MQGGEKTAAQEAPAMANPEMHKQLTSIKSEIFGHSDEPNWEAAEHMLSQVPGSEKALAKLRGLKEFYRTADPEMWKDGMLEQENWFRTNSLEHAIDELATHHETGPIANPNEPEHPGHATPIIDDWVSHANPERYPEDAARLKLRDLLQQHLKDSGQTETGVLSDWFDRDYLDEPNTTLGKLMHQSGIGPEDDLRDMLIEHLEHYP